MIFLFAFQTIGPYSVSKTAMLGLTKVLSAELAPQVKILPVCKYFIFKKIFRESGSTASPLD